MFKFPKKMKKYNGKIIKYDNYVELKIKTPVNYLSKKYEFTDEKTYKNKLKLLQNYQKKLCRFYNTKKDKYYINEYFVKNKRMIIGFLNDDYKIILDYKDIEFFEQFKWKFDPKLFLTYTIVDTLNDVLEVSEYLKKFNENYNYNLIKIGEKISYFDLKYNFGGFYRNIYRNELDMRHNNIIISKEKHDQYIDTQINCKIYNSIKPKIINKNNKTYWMVKAVKEGEKNIERLYDVEKLGHICAKNMAIDFIKKLVSKKYKIIT